MPDFTPEQSQYISDMQNKYYARLTVKKLFVEACLFMEGQTPPIKQTIANYYARLLIAVSTTTLFTLRIHNYSGVVIDESDQAIVEFFEKNILKTEKLQTANFKKILLGLVLEGFPIGIDFQYRNLSCLEKNRVMNGFNREYTHTAKNELIKEYKTLTRNKKKKKLQFINWYTGALLAILTNMFLQSLNEEHPNLNAAFSLFFGLFCHVLERAFLQRDYNKKYDDRLAVVYKKKSSLNNTRDLTLALSSKPKTKLKPASIPKPSSQSMDDYEISVVPISLFPENEIKKPKPLSALVKKRPQQASSQTNISPPVEMKKMNTLSPDYFGAAFSGISSDDFTKLEGCGWNTDSHVYAIWCVDKNDYHRDNGIYIDALQETFQIGRVATHGNCIKLLTGQYAGYLEVRRSGASRAFGKEFATIDGKTAYVFAYFDEAGLHDQNTHLNARIINHLDTAIEKLHELNLIMSSQSPTLRR